MKRTLLTFICAMLCALVCLSALSCKPDSADGGESSSPLPESSAPGSSSAESPAETPEESEDLNLHFHEKDERWTINESEHWHTCFHCAIRMDLEPHDFETIHINEYPTADKAGRGSFVCKTCGGAFDLTIPPLGEETN